MAALLNDGEGEYSLETIETELRKAIGEDISGTDSDEMEYTSIQELWRIELDDAATAAGTSAGARAGSTSAATTGGAPAGPPSSIWYSRAFNYWESEANCPVTDDGVLGGYGKLTPMDVKGSNQFLDELVALRPELCFDVAADCGAGIGRVSKNLLLHRFARVDLIEQSPRLTKAAPAYIGPDSSRAACICQGLQDFAPAPNTYDVIWIQWVIGHLHDLDFIRFFRRCVRGLRPGGVIVLKDNCCVDWTFVLDKDDRSVARCADYIRQLFRLAGLRILHEGLQMDFPQELYPVKMFAVVQA